MKKIFFYFLILFFISCGIFKKVSKNPKVALIDSIQNNQLKFKTLSYKFNAEYKSVDNNYSFFGSISIIKDSIILANISPGFGITLADIFISPDTIIAYLPLENSYFAGNKDFFLNNYNVALDFYSLQNILAANFFTYPYFENFENYSFQTDSILLLSNTLFNKRNDKLVDVYHSFQFTNNFKISNVKIEDNVLHILLFLNYLNYVTYESNKSMPSDIKIKLYTQDTLSLNLKLKNIQFDKSITNKFKLPKNAKYSDF